MIPSENSREKLPQIDESRTNENTTERLRKSSKKRNGRSNKNT
jgi:hypothetical protein